MSVLRLSARLSAIQPSMTMTVTARAEALRAEGVDIIGFGAGEPDFPTPDHVRAAAAEALARDPRIDKYTTTAGLPALREAVAATLGRVHACAITPAQVIVTNGAKQALYEVFQALIDPGDEVIVPAPCWVSYPDMVKLAGGTPVLVPTSVDDGFLLDPEALRRAMGPRTRALVLNNPCNPTGAVYDRSRLEALAAVILSQDVLVVLDDIYRHLVYDGQYESIAAVSPALAARTVFVDGVSKSYAMTGWRIGYAAGPLPLIQALDKLQGQVTSGASRIAQVAAVAALTGPQEPVEQMRLSFDQRRREMYARLTAIPGLRCMEPRGAFYCFPDVSYYLGRKAPDGEIIANDVSLCEYLVREARVALVPGTGFGLPGYVRLSYACGLDLIRAGVERIAGALARLS